MGQILYLQNKDKEAQQYLEKAIACLKRHGYYWGLERAEIYMAMLLKRQDCLEEAQAYYKESKQISEKIKNPITMELIQEFEENM
jgi:tetratricopeptide (TPR) repeat protein